MPAFTASAVIGSDRTRAPEALKIALPMAGATTVTAGCGSGKAYFQENGSHDHCVRNAHNLVSSWCSDELVSTTQP